MQRKNAIKAMAFSALSPQLLIRKDKNESLLSPFKSFFDSGSEADSLQSEWQDWPDMKWVGPGFWGNRLQDWQIKDGTVQCSVSSNNRTLHSLTRQLSDRFESFETSITIGMLKQTESNDDYVGFRLGAKGEFDDYRSAAVFGKGLDEGITPADKDPVVVSF